MSLGIFLHAAASFVVTPIGWAAQDPSANITADLAIGVIHIFRMPVFFLLSGFFARLVYVRLGIRGFVLHRLRRIIVPLVLASALLSPALDALWRWGGVVQKPGDALPRFDMGAVMVSSLAHLWFLYYLAVLLAIVTGVVWMLHHPLVERLTSRVDCQFGVAIQRRYLSFGLTECIDSMVHGASGIARHSAERGAATTDPCLLRDVSGGWLVSSPATRPPVGA